MKQVLLFFVTLSIIMSSCATYQPPKAYIFNDETVMDLSFDEAWSKSIKWLTKNNHQLGTIDKSSGFLQSAVGVIPDGSASLWSDCGKTGMVGTQTSASTYLITILIARTANNQTKATFTLCVSLRNNATNCNSTNDEIWGNVSCVSKGYLEANYINFMTE